MACVTLMQEFNFVKTKTKQERFEVKRRISVFINKLIAVALFPNPIFQLL